MTSDEDNQSSLPLTEEESYGPSAKLLIPWRVLKSDGLSA
jgi:hypothetical protein